MNVARIINDGVRVPQVYSPNFPADIINGDIHGNNGAKTLPYTNMFPNTIPALAIIMNTEFFIRILNNTNGDIAR